MSRSWFVEGAGTDEVIAWLGERLSPVGVTLAEGGAGLRACACIVPWLLIDDETDTLALAGDDGASELSRELSTRVVEFSDEGGAWTAALFTSGEAGVTGGGSDVEAMAQDWWWALSTWFAPPEGLERREPWLPLKSPAPLERVLQGLGARRESHGETCRTYAIERI